VLCRSTYSKHPHKEPWVLSNVVGEPLSWDPLEAISPEHPPEAIVASQVEALRWVGVRFMRIVTDDRYRKVTVADHRCMTTATGNGHDIASQQ
jgi:hypothetical protein